MTVQEWYFKSDVSRVTYQEWVNNKDRSKNDWSRVTGYNIGYQIKENKDTLNIKQLAACNLAKSFCRDDDNLNLQIQISLYTLACTILWYLLQWNKM